MLILSLDTSASFVSLALMEDEKAITFFEEKMERGQAEALIPLIQQLMEKAHKQMNELEAIAVSVGPGSFTGVRIGLAAARALGMALNIPVWGVTCFEAWAYHLDEPVLVALDSKREDFFVQFFDAKGLAVNAPSILSIEDLKAKMPLAVVGSGAQQLSEEIGARVIQKISPISVAIARIAFNRKEKPLPAEPFYMREADVTL